MGGRLPASPFLCFVLTEVGSTAPGLFGTEAAESPPCTVTHPTTAPERKVRCQTFSHYLCLFSVLHSHPIFYSCTAALLFLSLLSYHFFSSFYLIFSLRYLLIIALMSVAVKDHFILL